MNGYCRALQWPTYQSNVGVGWHCHTTDPQLPSNRKDSMSGIGAQSSVSSGRQADLQGRASSLTTRDVDSLQVFDQLHKRDNPNLLATTLTLFPCFSSFLDGCLTNGLACMAQRAPPNQLYQGRAVRHRRGVLSDYRLYLWCVSMSDRQSWTRWHETSVLTLGGIF